MAFLLPYCFFFMSLSETFAIWIDNGAFGHGLSNLRYLEKLRRTHSNVSVRTSTILCEHAVI